jgi:hypothetical protein
VHTQVIDAWLIHALSLCLSVLLIEWLCKHTVPCSVPKDQLALNITLGDIIEPPSPPSYDPFVLATLHVDNRTIKVRIGHVRTRGDSSMMRPSTIVMCACALVAALLAVVLA